MIAGADGGVDMIAVPDHVAAGEPMPAGRLLRAYCKEAKYEFLRMVRSPGFAIPTLVFPTLFYVLIGFVFGAFEIREPGAALYLFVGFATMSAITPGLFGFGVGLATEREQGLLALKRALPMPAGAALCGKMAMALMSVLIAVPLLALAALSVGNVVATAGQLLTILMVVALGCLPFCAMGLFIGTLANGRSATAIVNVIYMLMVYLSGLFLPLPEAIERIVVVLPAFYLHQLALHAAGAPSRLIGGAWFHVAALIATMLVFIALAARRFARVG